MALRRLGYEGRQTGHGFRHLSSTILNENGFDSQHVETQLSHVKEGVRGVYDKSTYLNQRKVMMQWYADHLDKLAAGNVITLKRKAWWLVTPPSYKVLNINQIDIYYLNSRKTPL